MAEESKKRIALMLRPADHRAAVKAAKRAGISFNELVRQSLQRHICLNFRQGKGSDVAK